jgi:hypothetical protein
MSVKNATAGILFRLVLNEGVGEHVRTRSHPGKSPGETAALLKRGSAPNEERWFLLPDRL